MHSPSSLPPASTPSIKHSAIGRCRKSGQLFRNRYRIAKVLGRGGFGVTFLAQDMTLPGNPLCVIKQLCPKSVNPLSLERARVRFRREARTLASLGSHSQIPRLLDYFTLKGEFYLVQEFIQGSTLAQEIRRSGRQSEIQVKRCLYELLPVLKFVHQHRIIHRDIKPPNIIRCQDDNRLVLIDFGAVRELLSDNDSSSYQAPLTQFVGTPGFSPPEQLALRPTFASDLYALGMTCLFMLTARTPIEFDVDPFTGELKWERSVNLSPHFSRVLSKMLKTAPEDRYQSVDDLQRDLDLEPYLDTLADCMHTQPPTPRETYPQPELVATSDYLTPIQRQAASIRRWKMRRVSRQSATPRRHGFTTSTSLPAPL